MPPKFGLIKMQGFAKGFVKGAAVGAAKPKPALLRPAAFGADDDEDAPPADEDDDAADRRQARGALKAGAGQGAGAASGGAGSGVDVRGVNASLVALQAHASAQSAKKQAAALAEDASVYAYDEVYDAMAAGRADKQATRAKDFDPSAGGASTASDGTVARKESRYITQLKKSADIRKVDDERLFQAKLKKEADAEAHIYGNKEKFVTAAYKEKLAEMGRWKDEDARLSALESSTTVEGKLSMSGFYANLLTKNLAMGTGDVERDATSAYTIGSKRNDHIRQLEQSQKQDWDAKHRSKKGSGEGEDDGEDFDVEAMLRRSEQQPPAEQQHDSSERGERSGSKRKHSGDASGEGVEAGSAAAAAAAAGAAAAAAAAAAPGRTAAHAEQTAPRPAQPPAGGGGAAAPESPGAAAFRAAEAARAAAESAAAAEAAKAAAVAAARERFLARKKTKQA